MTGQAYPDVRGSVADEKAWLRSWIDELYLWYREVPEVNPADYATPVDYFDALKSSALTSSGRPRDRFHFWLDTATWEALAQSGVQAGYGVQWVILADRPPRQVVAAYNEPDSPAAQAGIGRGAQVVAVDGVAVLDGTDVATLNAGLFPASADENHTLTILDPGAASPREVALRSKNVAGAPVQSVELIDTASGRVGYMLFNDHLATAESALIDAIGRLAGATDLVLDIRYNGGGFLDIASELAYMIAGPGATAGKTFERLTFNDKHPTTDPVTGRPLVPTPFHGAALGFVDTPPGLSLPALGLRRVFVLTGPGTCSASESVMNSLRGIDVQVIQIGAATCGKPYGFYPQDNCGTTYFSIEFQGVNDKGFGDYADGFVPGGGGPAGPPGCAVGDDFGHALGDPLESRLAAALFYRETGQCPPGPLAARSRLTRAASERDWLVVKSPWRSNRIVRR